MKTNIKDIVIGAFAVIGFFTLVTGFNSPQTESQVITGTPESQVITGTPESHIWELIPSTITSDAYLYNKVTGETYGLRKQFTQELNLLTF